MSANVFANGREISAKKAGNRINAAMPDPCLSPPSPPAGPIPVPYPNFSDDSRTDNGTKKVLISGEPVGRKSESSYKDCKGDEAATRNFGMGTISHTIQGKMKFVSWSFDVKFEGSNVPRHLDFMTGNHGSTTDGSTAPVIGKQMPGKTEDPECKKLDEENEAARNEDLSEETRTSQSFTLTSALRTKNGNTTTMFSAAPGDVVSTNSSRKYQPTNSSNKMACTDNEYDSRCKDHTEPKLLDPEWSDGGTIKMKIFHQTVRRWYRTFPDGTRGSVIREVQVDCMPCYSCRKSICAAEKCGLKVILCNKDNEEVPAENLCKNGEPQPPAEKKTRKKKDGTTEEYNDYSAQNADWGSLGL